MPPEDILKSRSPEELASIPEDLTEAEVREALEEGSRDREREECVRSGRQPFPETKLSKGACPRCEDLEAALRNLLNDGEAYKPCGEDWDADEVEYVCPWCERRVNQDKKEPHEEDCSYTRACRLMYDESAPEPVEESPEKQGLNWCKRPEPYNRTVDELLAKLAELAETDERDAEFQRLEREAKVLDWRRRVELREKQAFCVERLTEAVESAGSEISRALYRITRRL